MKRVICMAAVMVLGAQAVLAGAGADANAVLRKTVDKVLALLDSKELTRAERQAKIIDTINPVFDFELMAKLTLGRKYWPAFSKEQRQEFTDLFVKQLQGTYFEKVEQFNYEKVEYADPVSPGKNKIAITQAVLSKDDKVEITYMMADRDGVWKVYDVEVEHVSIVRSYAAEYGEKLSKGTPAELIDELKAKLTPADGDK